MSIIGTLAALPATIGRYQLRERIAHGGMGVLYLAFDPATEREVALKVLRVDSDDLRERFLREARLAARLQHPNIVTVYDVGAHEDQPFIAMEFIAGETLGQLVHRRAPLTLSRRIALMEQICVGPGLCAPARHRPSRRQAGQPDDQPATPGVLKVLDFGVAGRVDADPGAAGPDAHGHAELHVARAGRRAAVRPSQRHLLGRPGALRAAHLPPGLQWRVPAVDSLEGAERVARSRSPPSSPVSTRRCRPSSTARSRNRPSAATRTSRRCARTCRGSASASTPPRPRTTWSAGAPSPPGAAAGPAGRPAAGRRLEPARPALEPTHGSEPSVGPSCAPGLGRRPAPRSTPDVAEALAAAERDAYEGRFAAAIRRLEALGPHPDIDAALLHYRQSVAARDAARAQAASRLITDVIRAHVGGVRAAISAGRWHEAQELLRTLERDVPAPDDAARDGGPRARHRRRWPAAPTASAIAEPRPMRRDDEVAHYLSRARRRLEAGDVTAAQSLLDAALDMTRTP